MSDIPHEIADDYPGSGARLHALSTSDPHFLRLFNQNHDINRPMRNLKQACGICACV